MHLRNGSEGGWQSPDRRALRSAAAHAFDTIAISIAVADTIIASPESLLPGSLSQPNTKSEISGEYPPLVTKGVTP
jgi:hypothetical protein